MSIISSGDEDPELWEVKPTSLGHLAHKWPSFNKYLWRDCCVRGGEDLTRGQDWDLSLLPLELTLSFVPAALVKELGGVGGAGGGGGSVLVPRESRDDSVPAFPLHTGHPPQQTPHMEPESRVARGIVCPHKGQQPLSAQMWLCGLGCSCGPLPSRAGAAYQAGWQDSA